MKIKQIPFRFDANCVCDTMPFMLYDDGLYIEVEPTPGNYYSRVATPDEAQAILATNFIIHHSPIDSLPAPASVEEVAANFSSNITLWYLDEDYLREFLSQLEDLLPF